MMNVALVFIFGISIYVEQTCLSLEASSNEVDILWQKYGDLRSNLETMKAKRKLDLKRMKRIEKDIFSIKNTMGIKPEDTTERTLDTNKQQNDHSEINDNVVPIPGWEVFSFKLLKASIQHTKSSLVFSMEVHVDVSDITFSYYWYDDNIPIMQGDLNYSIKNYKKGTHHQLILESRYPKEYHEHKEITIWLIMGTQLQLFVFRYSDHNITKTYQGDVIYKVSTNSKNEADEVITGNFAIRSNYIQNKKIDPLIDFKGLNETAHQEYEALRVYGYENSGPWKKDLFIQNTSVSDDEFQMSNWTISETIFKHGGYLVFSISVGKFDDMFVKITIDVDDESIFTNHGYTLPGHFLAIFKDSYPGYLRTNAKNVIYCSAMGQPVPFLSLLRKESGNHIVPTGYQSVVMKTKYSAFLTSVVPEETKKIDAHYICVARSGDIEEMAYVNTTVVTLSKIGNAEITKNGDEVVIEITVNLGDPPKPHVLCSENEVDGPSLWERDDVYSTDETLTDTTFKVTISANFSGIVDPPRKFVCVVNSNYGQDVKTVHLY